MSSSAAFTICTKSYLPRARALADTFLANTDGWEFFIGLVDAPLGPDEPALPAGVTVVPAGTLGLQALDEMALRYNVVELCTALKPTYFRKLFEDHPDIQRLHYLDPDIMVYGRLEVLDEGLSAAAIQLTPHHLSPIPLDGAFPNEPLALNHGVFNLGYLGLRRSASAFHLLEWWEERMRELCVIDLREGLFVDQLWFNLVPIYFPDTLVLRHPGANVAYWNLHERRLTEGSEVVFQGASHPLLFFHFSGYSPRRPLELTRLPVRIGVLEQAALGGMLLYYARRLNSHQWERLEAIESEYAARRRKHLVSTQKRSLWKGLVRGARGAVPESIKRLLRP